MIEDKDVRVSIGILTDLDRRLTRIENEMDEIRSLFKRYLETLHGPAQQTIDVRPQA